MGRSSANRAGGVAAADQGRVEQPGLLRFWQTRLLQAYFICRVRRGLRPAQDLERGHSEYACGSEVLVFLARSLRFRLCVEHPLLQRLRLQLR